MFKTWQVADMVCDLNGWLRLEIVRNAIEYNTFDRKFQNNIIFLRTSLCIVDNKYCRILWNILFIYPWCVFRTTQVVLCFCILKFGSVLVIYNCTSKMLVIMRSYNCYEQLKFRMLVE